VDWLLEQFGLVLDERDAEIDRLRRAAHSSADPAQKTLEAVTDEDGRSDDDEERPHA
jgi:hypothetical protein